MGASAVQWNANWIWARDGGLSNEFLYFRREFTVKSVCRSARILITAESWYRLYINGKETHRGTSVSYPGQQIYDRLDIKKYLRQGVNCVGITVNYFGIPSGWSAPKDAGVLAQIEINDGRKQVIGTDGTWKWMNAGQWRQDVPRRSFWRNLEYVEERDYRQSIPGWAEPGFDDAAWLPALPLRQAPYGEHGNLEERAIKQITRTPVRPTALIRFGKVMDLIPTAMRRGALCQVRIPEKADKEIRLTGHLSSTGNKRARILLETDGRCRMICNGQALETEGAGPVKTADCRLVKGMNIITIILTEVRRKNMSCGILPLSGNTELQVYADRTGTYTGWHFMCGAVSGRSDAGIPADRVFPAAVQMTAEEIHDRESDAADGLLDGKPAVLPALPPNRSHSFILDMGREIDGYPQLDVQGSPGAIIDIGCAEQLTGDRIDPSYSQVWYADRFILDGQRRMVEPSEWKGLRYFQVTIRNVRGPVTIHSAGFDEARYPFVSRGKFGSSDAVLNRIWDISAESARLCMMDTPIDCPWREKRFWIGDAHHILRINYYAFGDYSYARDMLRKAMHFMDGQGRIFVCLPLKEEYPLQSMDLLMAIHDYWFHSGDLSLVTELWPRITQALSWLTSCTNSRGVYENTHPRTLMWIDNGFSGFYGKARHSVYSIPSMKLYRVLGQYAALAGQVGDRSRTQQYRGMAAALKKCVIKEFWDVKKGRFRDLDKIHKVQERYSEVANSAALVFGIADRKMAASIVENVFVKNERGGEGDPYFKAFTYEGLVEYGRPDLAFGEMQEKWGSMIDQGATSFWEGFKKNRSLCHGWAGYPAVLMSRYLLGVVPLEPGFKKIAVKPYTFGLSSASGIVPTPSGPVRVAWTARDGKISSMKVSTPPGVTVVKK